MLMVKVGTKSLAWDWESRGGDISLETGKKVCKKPSELKMTVHLLPVSVQG